MEERITLQVTISDNFIRGVSNVTLNKFIDSLHVYTTLTFQEIIIVSTLAIGAGLIQQMNKDGLNFP